MKLYDIAHSRTGDKGNISTISVILYNEDNYEYVKQRLTEDVVMNKFSSIGCTAVERYEVPALGALNFVLHNTLGGGVTRSLALDAHGKSLSSLMLDIDI